MNLDVASVTALRVNLWSSGFRPVPIYNADAKVESAGKRPLGDKWQLHARTDPPLCAASEAVAHALNTGVLTDGLRPIDFDIDDPDKAAECRALATVMLGDAPTRFRRGSPRALSLYRAAEGAPSKRTLTGSSHTKENSCKIEVLGKGQQFVAFGKHPSGTDLEWFPTAPGAEPYSSLIPVTEEQITAFLGACAPIIDAVPPTKANGATLDFSQDHTSGEPQAETSRIAAALGAIPNTGPADWEEWNKIGMATWAATAGGPDGWTAFDTWSAYNNAYDAKATRARWDNFAKSPPTLIGAGSIFRLAQANGWVDLSRPPPPSSPDDYGTTATKPGSGSNTSAGDSGDETPQRPPPSEPVGDADRRPEIEVRPGQLHIMATLAEAAIGQSGMAVYQRGRSLVHPVSVQLPASDGRTTVSAGLAAISLPGMVDRMSAAARWVKLNRRRRTLTPCNPPQMVGSIILDRAGSWTVPSISGVITTPTLRPDGSVISEPGYDAATHLYYAADPSLIMPKLIDKPDDADGLTALELLLGLLAEFPFVAAVDKAVALSGMITPVVRGAIKTAPMHAATASTPGTGKSYLVDVCSHIATGRPCPVIAVADNDAETEKRLVGLLLGGFPLISIDNVNGCLGSDLLCQAIERPLIMLRPLGGSPLVEIESRAGFYGNGNNITLTSDSTRRVLLCALDAGMERPELRKFQRDPCAMVLANRGAYVAACLTIVRAYLCADKPDLLSPLLSFGTWSDLVRSALVWLGCEDPCKSIEAARADDPALEDLSQLLVAWSNKLTLGIGYTTKEIANSKTADLQDILQRIARDREGKIDTARLGKWLGRHKGRIVRGLRLSKDREEANRGVAKWIVEQL